jgi:hypothetical protein
MTTVTITNAHGTFTTTALGLDLVMAKYLPASVNGLATYMEELTGHAATEAYYSDVHSVSEFLVMIADGEYPVN